jgi:hypothetical protein
VRGGAGWSAFRDVAIHAPLALVVVWALEVWAGYGSAFGLCGHRTDGALAPRGCRHHGSPPQSNALALPATAARAVTGLRRSCAEALTLGASRAPTTSNPPITRVRCRRVAAHSVSPTRAAAYRPDARVGLFGAMCSRQTGPCARSRPRGLTWARSARSAHAKQAHPPRRRRMTSQRDEQPTPLTPLGADRPRRHPDKRPSGTPEQKRHPSARNTPTPAPRPAPHDGSLGRSATRSPQSRKAQPSRLQQSCWCCRFATNVQRFVTTLWS